MLNVNIGRYTGHFVVILLMSLIAVAASVAWWLAMKWLVQWVQ